MNGFVVGDRGLGASGDTHPNWMLAYANFGPYLVVGASAIGQDHLALTRPRDDAFVIRCSGPWLAIGVSDGVGSRPLSRYGASYVADVLTSYLLNSVTSPPLNPGRSNILATAQHELRNKVPPDRIEENTVELPQPNPESSKPNVKATKNNLFDKLSSCFRRDSKAQESPLFESRPVPLQGLLQIGSVGWSLSAFEKTTSTRALKDKPGGIQPMINNKYKETITKKDDLSKVMTDAFRMSHVGLHDHAKRLQLEPSDLSCTALGLLFNRETGEIVAGQVGDGAILGLTLQGQLSELVPISDSSDPQSTYTINHSSFERFLAVQELAPAPANPPIALFIMTDGLSGDLLYSPDEGKRLAWARNVDKNLRYSPSSAQAATGMLNWLAGYQVSGSYDDRTLVVVTLQERENEHG